MKFNKFLLLMVVLLVFAGIFFTACDNRILDPENVDGGTDNYILTMWAEPDTIYADNENGTYATIYVLVKDQNDFVIFDQRVNFGANMGNIIAYDITDSTGVASVEFWDHGIPGIATISAYTDHIYLDGDGEEATSTSSEQISVYIVPQGGGNPTDVNSIGFDSQGQVDIQVAGTGGNESYNFIVSLYDVNGNLVQEPKDVYFQFVNAPVGTSINNTIFWPSTDSLSVVSSGGKASVPISSGEHSGTVSLRAFTYNDTILISTVKSEIVVHSGPPNSVAISIGGQDTGEEMGSGIWNIECAAFLTDQYNNPVDYGTAVYFSLSDTVSFASIYAPGYVGNENADGDSTSGIAYTYLNYDGAHINDFITVNVEVSNSIPGQQNFTDSQIVVLPMQFANIEMIAIPQHVDWDIYDNPSDWKSDEFNLSPKFRVIVRDGQQNLIKNQEVTFTSTLGVPVHEDQLNMNPTNSNFEPDFTDFTGPGNDGEPLSEADVNNGEIIQLFRFYKYECPPPEPSPPGSIQAQITATIVGTQTSATAQVVLNRYVD